jgi:hypothetical protein
MRAFIFEAFGEDIRRKPVNIEQEQVVSEFTRE